MRNQALQVIRERQKYGDGIGVVRGEALQSDIHKQSHMQKKRNKKELQTSSNFSNVDQVL